jgi:hypothetical protein
MGVTDVGEDRGPWLMGCMMLAIMLLAGFIIGFVFRGMLY